MSEEQYKIENAFLESLTIHTSQDLKMDFDIRTDGTLDDMFKLLSKFKTYLIEQGEHVTYYLHDEDKQIYIKQIKFTI